MAVLGHLCHMALEDLHLEQHTQQHGHAAHHTHAHHDSDCYQHFGLFGVEHLLVVTALALG